MIKIHLQEISKNTQAIAATNVANVLMSSINNSSSSCATSTSNSSFQSENEGVSWSTIVIDESPETPKFTLQQPGIQKDDAKLKALPYSKDLIRAVDIHFSQI